MSDRPNLLLITTDQQRWDSLSLYGRPGYRTPVLDRLAQEGIAFDRAYCPSPVCTPARVSILTGQYPTRHGAYEIGMEPVPSLQGPTVASVLADAGYRTALIGKTHFVARSLEHQHVAGMADVCDDNDDPPPEFWHEFDGPYVGFEFVRHCQSHTCDRPPNAHYRAWLEKRGLNLDHLHFGRTKEKIETDGNRVHNVNPYGRWDIDEQDTQTAWINEESLQWIGQCQERGEPWLCWTSYQDPHPPYVCPEPYFSEVSMEGVDLGGLREGETQGKPPLLRNFMEGRYWTEEPDVHFWDGINVPAHSHYGHVKDVPRAIQAYIGMCNMIDTYVGRLLDGLERMGARDNTLIVFTTDHGDMLGRHGMWGKGPAAYDDCQRIPAVALWPGQSAAVGRSPAAFNLVDIMPTFLDAAGVGAPSFVQGVSQLPVLRGEAEQVRDWALVDFLATVNLHQQTLIHDDYKLIVYRHADYGELYNMVDDPDQYENLFDRPDARDIRERMLLKLARANMEAAGVMPARISNA